MFRLQTISDRIGERVANLAATDTAETRRRALEAEVKKLRKQNAELRFVTSQDKLERKYRAELKERVRRAKAEPAEAQAAPALEFEPRRRRGPSTPRTRSFVELLRQFWGFLRGYRKSLILALAALSARLEAAAERWEELEDAAEEAALEAGLEADGWGVRGWR